MFDLYEFWYSQLLDETGELEDMDFTLFCIWKFTTVDGKFCQSEMEKEIMNDHRKNQQK